jgi:hypothetical protein
LIYRPWPHTIFIPLIWFFSALFAVPTAFWSEVRDSDDDFYKNVISYRPSASKVSSTKTIKVNGHSKFN